MAVTYKSKTLSVQKNHWKWNMWNTSGRLKIKFACDILYVRSSYEVTLF